MFCPSCGSEQSGQYCRACGADLRSVRLAVESPEKRAPASVSARNEIGRAVADKIREAKSWKELSKVVEGVLPELEKFLETPEEKRLRRIRGGMITAAIGLSVGLSFTLAGALVGEEGFIFFGCLGFVVLTIGLGVLLNGWHFTVAQKQEAPPMPDVLQNVLRSAAPAARATDESFPNSITEHTTHQLPELPARARQAHRE